MMLWNASPSRCSVAAWWIGCAAMGLALIGMPSRAQACGGFWCSQSAPVNQVREQILFAQNGDGTTTCVVQIAYQGPSERFAWVLPVQGVPEVGVSSTMAIQRLTQATEPQYVLDRHVIGDCAEEQFAPESFDAADGSFGGASGSMSAPPAPRVDVLAQGSVGPYDYAVIRPDPTLPSPADTAIEWLTTEGYDITGISSDVLGPYLADGLNLIAFRLTKGQSSGSIRPVFLKYAGDRPSIPIRPTAVAAQEDMGILVWVLAESQAVPQNYRSLVLNEALINWFNWTSTYEQVVTQAANEADGQGFVTEFAGDSAEFDETVYGPYEEDGWRQLQTQAETATDPLDLIWTANGYYRGWDGWRETIEAAVTLPEGTTIDDFGRNPDAYRDMPGFSVDGQLFMQLLYTNVVEPMEKTQQLIDGLPYLTRLYSTMSPSEMTLDPIFTFNSDLAPVSNKHTADMYIFCQPSYYQWEAPWRIELPRGGSIVGRGDQSAWPMPLDGSMPANRKIVQLSESGSGQVIEDNSVDILSTIVERGGINSAPTMAQPEEGMPIGGLDEPVTLSNGDSGGGGFCTVSAPGARAGLGGLAVAGLLLGAGAARRRRRAQK